MHYNQLNEFMNPHMTGNPIEPGMPATMYVGSDRYAMIVREVKSPKRIVVSHMHNAHYDQYIKDPGKFDGKAVLEAYNKFDEFYGPENYYRGTEYSLRKNGRWMPVGAGMWDTCSLQVGEAENYRDPSF